MCDSVRDIVRKSLPDSGGMTLGAAMALGAALALAPAPARAFDFTPSPWAIFINPGITVGNHTVSTYNLSSGDLLTQFNSQDPIGKSLELELDYRPMPYLSLGPILGGYQYVYNGGGVIPNDHVLSFMFFSRVQTGETGLVLWAGCAGGMMLTYDGDNQFLANGGIYDLQKSYWNPVISPRFGLDYVLEGYTFGLQAQTMHTTSTLHGTEQDQFTQLVVPVTDNMTRTMWEISARFGFQL